MLEDKKGIERFETDVISTPVGDVIIVVADGVLLALDFAGYRDRMTRLLTKRFGPITLTPAANPGGISHQVQRYFDGEITALAKVPMATGGTPFQRTVWNALRQIEPGTVSTYGDIAKQIDNPKAVRAVGMANSLNPIAIALPCHRVVGTNEKLTGYAGGLERKRWLLEHEGVSLTQSVIPRNRQTTAQSFCLAS